MSTKEQTNLDKMLSVITKEHVYIQTHNFPDPDAIASAYGLQQLLRYKGIGSTVCYKGKIERYNANYIINKLGITFENVKDLDDKLSNEDEIILVDSQKFNSNIIDIAGDEIICIDHHPTMIPATYRFADIRPEIGACASIVASYFFENDIPMDAKTALVLTFGIRSDTDKLSRGVNLLDLEMLYKLFPLCDSGIIFYLENSELMKDDLRAFSKAIDSVKLIDRVAFANAGADCDEALTACISDFMLEMVEVHLSVVYSRKKDGFKFSVRSATNWLDAGQIIASALEGIGNGGGHDFMAGGFVPVNSESLEETVLIHTIVERISEAYDKAYQEYQEWKKTKGNKK